MKRLCKELSALAIVLGGSTATHRWWLYLRLATISINWKLFGPRPFFCTFTFRGESFTYSVQDSTDIAALVEIYVEKEYDWELPFAPDVIIDLGANFGDTALYYNYCYPSAKVIAVEPSKESFERLVTHTAERKQIIPVRAALAATNEPQTFYLMPGNALGNSTTKRTTSVETVEVPGVTLAALLHKYTQPTDRVLIKFDIEGGETDLFTYLSQVPPPAALIGEVHFDLIRLDKTDVENAFSGYDLHWTQLSNTRRAIVRALANTP